MLNIEPFRPDLIKLCRRLQVKRLDLFGSATTAFYGPTSDIDVVVEFDRTEGRLFDRYFDLKEGLEALFDRSVDVVMAESTRNPYFREAVDTSRRPVYAECDSKISL